MCADRVSAIDALARTAIPALFVPPNAEAPADYAAANADIIKYRVVPGQAILETSSDAVSPRKAAFQLLQTTAFNLVS